MESKKIYTILEQVFEKNNYKKIFINGPWGIGKSYYSNKYFEDNKERNIFYISLFGKANINDIENEINKQVLKKVNNAERIFHGGKRFFSKFNASIDLPLVNIDIPNIGQKFLLEGFAEKHEDEKILIIIDDIERKSNKISIIDIMGIIESMSLINNIKLVLIGDENNISKEDKDNWKNFKEKLIEKEYKIDSFSPEAIESLIIEKTDKYVNKKELKNFISDFFNVHKVKNLRTINKSVNLFIEILENYVNNKQDKENNLIIFKNCLAVTIELTEELYKPNEDDKNSKDTTKMIMYELNNDIKHRILSHYFNAMYASSKESTILSYIIDFNTNNVNSENIKEFNETLNSLKNEIHEEKNIFYLSEDNIIAKVKNIIDSIKNKTYIFTTIKNFMDDIYQVFNWNEALELNYNKDDLYKLINTFIVENYYDTKKEEYQNKIDSFYILRDENENIKKVINNYNSFIEKKYIDDRIKYVLDSYNSKEYDCNKLEYFKQKLMQRTSDYCKKEFHKLCENNNYLLPDLSSEIDDNSWHWTHNIWDIYKDYMDEEFKSKLNIFANKKLLNNKNFIEKYRIEALLKYKPLLQK